jgi:hypothetical protein
VVDQVTGKSEQEVSRAERQFMMLDFITKLIMGVGATWSFLFQY